MTRVSSIAQLSIRIRPDCAKALSDKVGNGSSNRRYVLTMSSRRPSADSKALTASIRAGWVNTLGLTQAPSSPPAAGGRTGPASNGPVWVAIGGVPAGGEGASAGRCGGGAQVVTVTVTAPSTARPARPSSRWSRRICQCSRAPTVVVRRATYRTSVAYRDSQPSRQRAGLRDLVPLRPNRAGPGAVQHRGRRIVAMRLADQSPQQFHPPAGTAGEVVLHRRAVRKRAYDQPAQVPALTRVDGTGVAVRRVDHPLVLVHRAR